MTDVELVSQHSLQLGSHLWQICYGHDGVWGGGFFQNSSLTIFKKYETAMCVGVAGKSAMGVYWFHYAEPLIDIRLFANNETIPG